MEIIEAKVMGFKGAKFIHIVPKKTATVIGGKNAAGKCVPEGTLIAMWDGSRKEIQNVRETDTLVGLDPNTWKFIPESPVCLMTSGVQDVYEIKTKRGFFVRLTLGHRLLCPEGWKEAKDLSADDYIAVPMKLPVRIGGSTSAECTQSMLMGLLLGDGSLTRTMQFSVGDEAVENKFIQCCNELWPSLVVKVNTKKLSKGRNLRVSKGKKEGRHKTGATEWLDSFGLRGTHSYTKFIPEFFFSLGDEALCHFAAGLFSTDGWIQEDGYAEYYSRSLNLAYSAKSILLRLGIPTSMTKYMRPKSPGTDPVPMYRVATATSLGRSEFLKKVCPLICRTRLADVKKTRLFGGTGSQSYSLPPYVVKLFSDAGCPGIDAWIRGHNRMSLARMQKAIDNNKDKSKISHLERFTSKEVGWDQVVSIEKIGPLQTFDLQMPSEAFIANDVIVHNSSFIDAIAATLGGAKLCPKQPIRKGETAAKVELKLSGDVMKGIPAMTAVREWWYNDKGEVQTKLELISDDGFKAGTPQGLLNDLTKNATFDPEAFIRSDNDKQLKILKELVGIDTDPLDAEYKKIYDARTIVGNEGKKLRGKLDGMIHHEGVPDEEQSAVDLMKQVEEINAHNRANDEQRSELKDLESKSHRAQEELTRLRDKVSDLEVQLAHARQMAEHAEKKHNECISECTKQLEVVNKLKYKDTSEITQQMKSLEEINKKVRENKQRADYARQREEKVVEYKTLSDRLEAIKKQKQEMVETAKWPVDGLGWDENGVTYNGRPLAQASGSEQRRVAMGVCVAAKPTLRVALIHEGSALDNDSLYDFAQIAGESGVQLFIERVSVGEECSIIIQDGEVIRADEGMEVKEEK